MNSSDQACADKVALALNSSQTVPGAWECFDDFLKSSFSHPDFPARAVSSDKDISSWLNPTKYMETVKFVGHRSIQGEVADPSIWLLYRVEGHPNGQGIVGYQEIEIDTDSGLVHTESVIYCQPQGDINCAGLPL